MVLVASLAAVALVVTAMTVIRPSVDPAVAGTAVAADSIDTDGAGMPIRRVPATGAGPYATAEGRLVAATITDLTTFWSERMPAMTGHAFTPLRGGLTAMDSTASAGTAPCVADPAQIAGNAFYCPADAGIVYDAATLVPVLLHRYGIAGLVTTFAHEFGHAAQAEMDGNAASGSADGPEGSTVGSASGLMAEARADCDAGAFLDWVVTGHAAHVHLGTDALVDAVGPLLDFADPATASASDPSAHGLALDRLTWVVRGYRGGTVSCAALASGALHPTLGMLPEPAAAGESDYPARRFTTRRALLDAAERSLRSFVARGSAALADGEMAADAQRATESGLWDRAAPYGQMAQATVLALEVGRQRTPTTAGAACFVGAWVASIFGDATSARPAADALGSWPGDADEALAAVRAQPHVTFADLAAYADGFHGGLSACR